MHEAVHAKTGIDFFAIEDDAEARRIAKEKLGMEPQAFMTRGHLVAEAFDRFCEKDYRQPTFITGHPVAVSPLAKRAPEMPELTHRFELYINGWEIANGFSELNNPLDQRERFEAQLKLKAEGDEESHPMDEDFINALEVGLPPTAGLGIGVDRLVMLLTDASSIRDILFFPTMKQVGGRDADERTDNEEA